MRYWDDKDAHGNKLTDGRVCLVIEPDDPTLPSIRTYGRDKDEVLDKVAKTAETAQATITRLRSSVPATPASPSPTTAPPLTTRRRLTEAEQAQATADLSNPAKSPAALKALLGEAGFDIDQANLNQNARRVAAVAQEWEKSHPDFPRSERNDRLLLNTAALKVGFQNITAAALDAAYQELLSLDMLFEADEAVPATTVPPNGNSDSRTVRPRSATSYRTNALRSAAPVARPDKPKYTRAEIDAMNSRVYRDKYEHEPGFKEIVNQLSAATA